VFRGSESPILYPFKLDYNPFVGLDGFGDSKLPPPLLTPIIQEEHAVNAIRRLAEGYASKGQPLSILALAPLTNLALALRMDPNIANYLREVVILGGNIPGEGLERSEFNFDADAEAAFIVLQNMNPTPIKIVPWANLRNGPNIDCVLHDYLA